MADNINIKNVTELDEVTELQDDDMLLLIRKDDEQRKCYRIDGNAFRGKSAYEVAKEMGYSGSYESWKAQIQKASSLDITFNPESGCIVIN